MQDATLLSHIRSIRAALETYRDAIDELERANWSGDIVDALRRIEALARIAAGRTTTDLEHLAGLPHGKP